MNHEGVAVIRCPKCEAHKTVRVDNFKGAKHILKIKCGCQAMFKVDLEFRKLYRKMASFPGHYLLLPEKNHRHQMTVVNISKGGFGLQVSGDHRLKIGQTIQVRFTLDDKQRSLIDRQVFVRLVKDNYVSCELVNGAAQDKALGFYMMA